MSIFIDSGIFIAFSNKRDVNHEKARALIKRVAKKEFGSPITSDYVFDEVITTTFIRTKRIELAIKIGNLILGKDPKIPKFIKLINVSENIFLKAWDIFKKYEPKNLSFTDATIISMMENYKIGKLCSFDKNFDGIVGRVF